MKFFRKSDHQPAETPAPEPGPQPTLRRAEVGDVAFGHVLAAQTTPPGPAREERAASLATGMDPACEHWVLEGLDGTGVGLLSLREAGDGVVEAWGAVDPVMRRFGMGERLFEKACAWARDKGATTLTSWAEEQGGYAFLVDHGFVAGETVGARVTGTLAL